MMGVQTTPGFVESDVLANPVSPFNSDGLRQAIQPHRALQHKWD
jgi:hypothetical protein